MKPLIPLTLFSFPQTLSSLPLPTFFLSPTFAHSILPCPYLTISSPLPLLSLLHPVSPYSFHPSFLRSFHSLLSPSPSTSTPPIFLSGHHDISAIIRNQPQVKTQLDLNLFMTVCECWFVVRWITNHFFYNNSEKLMMGQLSWSTLAHHLDHLAPIAIGDNYY